MSNAEFDFIVNQGALSHPFALLRLTRAYLCLKYLIDTVPGCAEALRRWCQNRDMQDEIEE